MCQVSGVTGQVSLFFDNMLELVFGGSVIKGAYPSSFRKVLKNVRPYLAIFLEKNATLLGVFLKQYKKGRFFKLIFWYVLKF